MIPQSRILQDWVSMTKIHQPTRENFIALELGVKRVLEAPLTGSSFKDLGSFCRFGFPACLISPFLKQF